MRQSDMDGDWVFLMVLWVGTVAIVVIGVRPITQRQLVRWSVRYNVLVDQTNDRWVSAQLRRARALRWTAFAVGLNVGMLPMYMNVIDAERAASFSNEFTGQAPFLAAAVGAVIAEVSLVRRPTGQRSALIVTRRWFDYIQRFWILAVVGALPVSLLAALYATTRAVSYSPWVWVAPVTVVFALVTITAGVHVVVNRPSVATDESERRLDDALRADGAHHVVGASVAVAGMATCSALTVALGRWGIIPALFTYVVLGQWYAIALTTRWNVDQARLQHV